MTVRARSTVLAACVAAAALVLAGCGGGGTEADDGGASAAPATSAPLEPIPAIKPADVKPLVGRWVGPAEDYFQFKADGTGVWVKGGRKLWSGTAIPEGGGRYRFSWQGGDPKTASYWGVSLSDGNSKIVFAGTSQKYTKAAARKGRTTGHKGKG
ncbi:hypothetical protein [Actinomadura opuntiae]|uniref:hypothetical protein n=1 Tax=Actinomadura sp. OS1-43 TaxID=604315 RepID=UPI00255A9948|nr:hypothetical protein [Actinomadura sp. OS1-43]MDL4820323.1 hypothetical protein [Actinomadura sp. OS1-43]